MQIKLNKSLLSLAISGIFLSSSAIAAPVEKAEYQYFTGQHDSYLQTSDKIVGSYVANWANPTIVDGINGDNLSHIIYAFLTICGESQASSVNTICINKADFQLAEDNSSVDKAFSSKFSDLKKQYPHLKILPSVGGWGLSDMFAPMTHAPESRAIFVQSVVQYLQNNPAFDGIDIDWEWPKSSAEGQGYVDLMKDLRGAFDQLSIETGREYQITSALSTTQSHIQHVDYVKASSYMDYIFMMTYDFTGAWSMDNIGHHTALKNHSANTWGHSADAGTHNMLNAGIPAEKLVLGVAKYARGFNGVTLSEQGTVLGGQATGVFPKKVKPWHADGVAIYSRVANDILGPQGTGINGFEIIYDAECECTYAWRDSDKAFVGFDHPRDVINKAEYVNNNNLAGVFSWEYGQDNGDILNAMNHGVGNLLKSTVDNNLPPVIDAPAQISVDSASPVLIQASVSDPDVTNQLQLTSSHGQITQMGPDATIYFDAPTVDKDTDIIVTLTLSDGIETVEHKVTVTVKALNTENSWVADIIYNSGDTVIWNDVKYVAKWWTKGQKPDSSSVWAEFDDGGTKEWQADKVYTSGTKAIYQGTTYEAMWWSKGDQPGNGAPWK